jgi:hypothetical protein
MIIEPEKKNDVPAVSDGFATSDPTDSPLRGIAIRFKDESYFSYGDEIDVKGKSYAVIGRKQGWQKLAEGVPPEYLMRQPGQPKPPQPFVDKKDWPLDFNKQPAHPWKWCNYLYLLDTATGEFSTFWSNTVGGGIAVRALDDQVALMRNVNPKAMPVIALKRAEMPTQFGSTTPRPHFQLLGWKEHGADPQNLLAAPEQKLVDVETPTLEETMGDEVPKDWPAKGDPLPDLGAPKTSSKKKKH